MPSSASSEDGYQVLGEALARHPNITELDLSKNFFQGGGYAQRLSPFEACAVYVYACRPKTVPVKRTFLNIAIVGWSGVGWGGMLTFLVLRT